MCCYYHKLRYCCFVKSYFYGCLFLIQHQVAVALGPSHTTYKETRWELNSWLMFAYTRNGKMWAQPSCDFHTYFTCKIVFVSFYLLSQHSICLQTFISHFPWWKWSQEWRKKRHFLNCSKKIYTTSFQRKYRYKTRYTLRSPYVQKLTYKFLNLSIKEKFVKFVENLWVVFSSRERT